MADPLYLPIDDDDPDIAALAHAVGGLSYVQEETVNTVRVRCRKLRNVLGRYINGSTFTNPTVLEVMAGQHRSTPARATSDRDVVLEWDGAGSRSAARDQQGSGYSRLKLQPVTFYYRDGWRSVKCASAVLFSWDGKLLENPATELFAGPRKDFLGWKEVSGPLGDDKVLKPDYLPLHPEVSLREALTRVQPVPYKTFQEGQRKALVTEFQSNPEAAMDFIHGTEHLVDDLTRELLGKTDVYQETLARRQMAQLDAVRPAAAPAATAPERDVE